MHLAKVVGVPRDPPQPGADEALLVRPGERDPGLLPTILLGLEVKLLDVGNVLAEDQHRHAEPGPGVDLPDKTRPGRARPRLRPPQYIYKKRERVKERREKGEKSEGDGPASGGSWSATERARRGTGEPGRDVTRWGHTGDPYGDAVPG